jgi:hypothetical protein
VEARGALDTAAIPEAQHLTSLQHCDSLRYPVELGICFDIRYNTGGLNDPKHELALVVRLSFKDPSTKSYVWGGENAKVHRLGSRSERVAAEAILVISKQSYQTEGRQR